MAYNDSEAFPTQGKDSDRGRFGVGKTTFVGEASEIEPSNTVELITAASVGVDSLDGIDGKSTTTALLAFGRITIAQRGVVLYLFGTPRQERFWFMRAELSTYARLHPAGAATGDHLTHSGSATGELLARMPAHRRS